jgi:hypothetical protein
MNPRNLSLVSALTVFSLASGLAVAQTKATSVEQEEVFIKSYKTPNYKAPRAQDGHADLQGVWANNNATPLQRPKEMEGRATISDDEVKALMKKAHDIFADGQTDFGRQVVFTTAYGNLQGTKQGFKSTDGDTGDYSSIWQVGEDWTNRTSLIIDPADGKLPALTPRGQALARGANFAEGQRNVRRPDSYEDLGNTVRCLTYGAPRIDAGYNSYMQIFQSPTTVVIQQEHIHDNRIIHVDGSPHPPANIRFMLGDSRGHWEGDTLVIDTTNYRARTVMNNSEKLHVVERIQRTAENYLTWTVTFDDPDEWVKPWTAEIPLRQSKVNAIYEYACHEGNYGIVGILAGARAEDAKEAAGATGASETR